MTKSHANKEEVVNDKLLTLPVNAGRAIVEAGAVISCPLLGTDRFIKFCRERGLSVDRERLLRLERLGLFAPVFRVRTPKKDTPPFYIPVRKGNNWFTKKWAWDTTGIRHTYIVPDHKDQTQNGYYSIFQIDYLHLVLMEMTLQIQLDSYLDRNEEQSIDWQKNGESWMQYAGSRLESLQTHEYRRSVALLCQFISNRYFPKTQSDQRTIQVGGGHYSDHWISVNGFDWKWHDEVQNWNPETAERLFGVTREKLHHAYNGLAVAQAHCDPLERWYQLTQFVAVGERAKLKGDALRAETLRAGAHMLRLLYKDLYEDELPNSNEVTGTIITHIPELPVRQDPRRYLEFVVNRFGLNPQPKLSLIVEGQSEEVAVQKIFEKYFGAHPGVYGIEIIVLGSVDVATGSKKEDRFRAILRLVDYLHHHQTFTFLILDNENYAERLKRESRKSKSIHSKQRYVTRTEYIRIWKDTFEFDNFSCSEIAAAMNELAQGYASFTTAEVTACKKDPNPGSSLQKLYENKAQYGLQKIKLSEILIEHMMSPDSRRRIENRPIIKVLERVARLAARNPLPTMHETWEKNQASRYLGKKRKPARQRKST
ncbi:MAG: hypothetical protein DIZ78_03870 [endosymbiont of Escarpia spicata]|uniref:Uncharacterized protein n=1 Tax=endosymbiont of Escarpia spicata TaxID=2200908 RepID=A0A370DT22_9GAMM|nr:MAG: hypothetical protein DIZ78_03870 [endosymbiont of Escarpia spicata]